LSVANQDSPSHRQTVSIHKNPRIAKLRLSPSSSQVTCSLVASVGYKISGRSVAVLVQGFVWLFSICFKGKGFQFNPSFRIDAMDRQTLGE
jgi:hypothetical protein